MLLGKSILIFPIKTKDTEMHMAWERP